jgi:hypothetical protein
MGSLAPKCLARTASESWLAAALDGFRNFSIGEAASIGMRGRTR